MESRYFRTKPTDWFHVCLYHLLIFKYNVYPYRRITIALVLFSWPVYKYNLYIQMEKGWSLFPCSPTDGTHFFTGSIIPKSYWPMQHQYVLYLRIPLHYWSSSGDERLHRPVALPLFCLLSCVHSSTTGFGLSRPSAVVVNVTKIAVLSLQFSRMWKWNAFVDWIKSL
jgi:hypothetical protein